MAEDASSSSNGACPMGGSERQVNGFMLPDSLDTQREQSYDRLGFSVVGVPDCKSTASMTSGLCTMKTTGSTMLMNAVYDRQSGKCTAHTSK